MRPGDLVLNGGAGCNDTLVASRSPANCSSITIAEHHVVLPAIWFAFVVGRAFRHALRHGDYLTLVTIRASREHIGLTVDVGAQILIELAEVVGPTIRDTDFIGELDDGRLGVLLSDADDVAAFGIIQRFAEVLGDVQFSVSLAFEIGVASCPSNGVDLHGLVAHAVSHPVLNVRARPSVVAERLSERLSTRRFVGGTSTEPSVPHA